MMLVNNINGSEAKGNTQAIVFLKTDHWSS